MISIAEAHAKQDAMQAQGQRLLESLNLVERLKGFGEVHIQGSFLYGLMVKEDIDMYVLVDEYDLEEVAELAKQLIIETKAGKVAVDNTRTDRVAIPGVPKAYYMGLKPSFENVMWNFDIWFVKEQDLIDQQNFPLGWEKKLSQEQRDAIIFLKANLKEQKLYPHSSKIPGSYASADVYRAVMNDSVKTVDELHEWRKTHPYY